MTTSVLNGDFAPSDDRSLRDRFTAWLHDGFARSMLPVRLLGGQIVYVPLVEGIEFTLAGAEAAGT